ncbi:uncharacterized protein NESG_01345 [Nematocida ausubeli]|uniref:Uncharacterized protein n=1 Tax=Nematocida ausubeli (strain ATCC PRA-371 / ERTm2) TaxID=1913371 RepID=A0A086J260_NEMA1|nr:uncharacterized protein NESG_01345 [Nematocida ausubeli]KFG26228.1 hypothetical protein NESG_01345 [Nematocida ausubeli]
MKVILAVHLGYLVLLLSALVKHIGLPLYYQHRLELDMQEVKNAYNVFVRTYIDTSAKDPLQKYEEIKKLREIVIYSDIVGCDKVKPLLSLDPVKIAGEVDYLYAQLVKKINQPRKVHLQYSLECNLGMLCSLILPSVLVVLTNLKGLIKTHSLSHCFTKNIYG